MASAAEAVRPLGPLAADVSGLVERAGASVVQVFVHGRGAGAAVVWDADGGLITNHHVVGDGGAAVEVLLPDGRRLPAEVVRRHPGADLALLQIPAGGLEPASPGDSDRLRVGQLVFAIGHPWGRPNVVTAGIVSALGEMPMRWGGRPVEYIRSDVGLAPGNSGGPMVDAAGQVVGINSMILGGDLAAAIPVRAVQRWLARGSVPRAFLGAELRPVQLRGPRARAAGLLVSGLRRNGPAERAGLLLGDVLVGFDGEALPNPNALAEALAERQPGDTAPLDLVRGGRVQRLEVTLGAAEPA